MIVLDANILLYAYDSSSRMHAKARERVEELFSGGEPVGLPWQTVAVFLRVVTNPRLPGRRFSPEEAAELVQTWLDQPNVRLLAPGDLHWDLFREMLITGQCRGPLVMDAQLAALALEYGGVLHSTDRDFGRFSGLRWSNAVQ